MARRIGEIELVGKPWEVFFVTFESRFLTAQKRSRCSVGKVSA